MYCSAAEEPEYTVLWVRARGLPSASMLTCRAAARYCSRNDGLIFSTSATLLNPELESSRGSSDSAFTSRSSSCLMALAYSGRFRRCSTTEPGFGFDTEAKSSAFSTVWMKLSRVAASGCGSPVGGISAQRSLRATSSHTLASEATDSFSMVSKATPPAQSSELWQLPQYLSTNSQFWASSAAGAWPEDAGCCASAAPDAIASITPSNTFTRFP